VFAALRDDSAESAEARQEPVLAIVILGGIAGVLSTSLTGRLLDDSSVDGPVALAAWAFLGGAAYGLLVYWLGGLMVHALARGIGADSSYRQARHVVGLAAAPVAASLLVAWPVRLAIYGDDVFRTGGSDSGLGDWLFDGLVVVAFAWFFGLVALGLLELKRSSSSSAIS
jgi:Yip1 domain